MEESHVNGDMNLLQTVDDQELHKKFLNAVEAMEVSRLQSVPFIGPPLPHLDKVLISHKRMSLEERYRKKCHAIQSNGRRCGYWSIQGTYYCLKHSVRIGTSGTLVTPMGMAYTKFLGPSLKEAVNEALNIPISEQKSLSEEVAVSRGLLARSLQLLGAVEKAKNDPEKAGKVTLEMELQALKLAREGLNGVADMVTKLTAIEKASDGQLSTQQLSFFVQNLLRIIFEVLGDEHKDLAVILSERIKADLVIPGQLTATGTPRKIPAPISDSPPVLRAGDMEDIEEAEAESGVDQKKLGTVKRNGHDIIDSE